MKKILIIGTGGIGKRHIRGFLRTGRAKIWIVEPSEEKRQEVLRDYAIEEGYPDLKNADLASFDLAVICAPAQCRHTQVHRQRLGLLRGEKPYGRTEADGGARGPFCISGKPDARYN